MVKVYVAGPIRDLNPIKFLQNVKNGIRAAATLIGEGYAPFCPHLDYQYFLQWEGFGVPDLERIMDISIEWLRQCDAMLILPGWRDSEGTMAEMRVARLANIPIFFSLSILKNHFKTNQELNHKREGL